MLPCILIYNINVHVYLLSITAMKSSKSLTLIYGKNVCYDEMLIGFLNKLEYGYVGMFIGKQVLRACILCILCVSQAQRAAAKFAIHVP